MLELQDIVFEVPLAEGSRETKRIIDGISLTIDTDKFVVCLLYTSDAADE